MWPTNGQIGYITPAVSGGVPNASERGIKLVVPHMSVDWLHIPYCLGGPQRFKAGDKIGGGPTSGRSGYITPAI